MALEDTSLKTHKDFRKYKVMHWLKGKKSTSSHTELWYRLLHTQSTVTLEIEPKLSKTQMRKWRAFLFFFPLMVQCLQILLTHRVFPFCSLWHVEENFESSSSITTMTAIYCRTVLSAYIHYLIQSWPFFEMEVIITSVLGKRNWRTDKLTKLPKFTQLSKR